LNRVKRLSLALGAMLALSGLIGVGSAWAEYHSNSPTGNTLLEAKSTGAIDFNFEGLVALPPGVTGPTLSCQEVKVAPGVQFGNAFAVWSGNVSFNGCTSFGEPVTVNSGSCDFQFAAPGKDGSTNLTVANSGSSSCDQEPITWFWRPQLKSWPECEFKVGSQTGIGPMRSTTTGEGEHREVVTVSEAKRVAAVATCGSTKETSTNGTIKGHWRVASYVLSGGTKGSQTPLWVDHPREFHAESEPVIVEAEQLTPFTFPIGEFTLSCEKMQFSTTSGSANVGTLTASPLYSGCGMSLPGIMIGAKTTFSRGGCQYSFGSDGTLSVVGSECATEPMTFTGGSLGLGCTLAIGPQTVAGLNYENQGAGASRKVNATEAISSLEYTVSDGPFCYGAKTGTFTNGSLSAQISLKARSGGLWVE
jgi:hypothetical protein